jgi:hypothetical protein
MARPKGQPKLGGRQKGVPNKTTQGLREKFETLLDSYNGEMMLRDLMAIESPKERLQIMGQLSEYIIPKLARSEVKNEISISETQVFKIGDQTISFGE